MSKSHSSGLLDNPDDEEYEYMNKQLTVTPVSLRHNSYSSRPNKKRTSSVSSQMTACSCETTQSVEIRGGHTKIRDNSDSEQQAFSEVEYEYMDIRGNENEESPPADDPPPPPTSTRTGEEVKKEREDEYVEDSNYHYTNRQPNLRQALQDRKELKTPGNDKGEAYEYEDMDCFAAPHPAEAVVYQNLQREGEGAVGGTEVHPHVKVRAGVGRPVAGDRSFDNPGYWHSKMFLKSNAVPT